MRTAALFLVLFALSAASAADDPTAAPPPQPSVKPPEKKLEAPKGKWINISAKLTAAVERNNGKPITWPGQTGGLTVDPTNGDLYVVVIDNGVWRSTDRGETYVRIDKGVVTGRAETGFSLDMNPGGKALMCFMVGGSSAMLLNNGESSVKSPASNMNFGAVDWGDGKTLFAVRHETKGWGWMSFDGAESWKDCGPGWECIGLFDADTFVAVRGKEPGIQRSEDHGATWEKVAELTPNGRVMKVFKGVGYWTSAHGLLVSKDKGKTWAVQGDDVDMSTGPYFGKDEDNLIVAGHEGLFRTTDGGKHWKLCAPYPEKFKFEARGWFGNFAWDPVNDILYASVMGQPAFRWEYDQPGAADAPEKSSDKK